LMQNFQEKAIIVINRGLGMKLNVGSGCPEPAYRDNEWVNIDLMFNNHLSVQGNMLKMPFKDNSFEEAHLIHTLEHLPRDKSFPVLCEIKRVLKPGGRAFIEVPNIPETVKQMHTAYQSKDRAAVLDLMISLYGKSNVPGMAHLIGFDEVSLTWLMGEGRPPIGAHPAIVGAGFSRVERSLTMVSRHFKHTPVLLMVGTK
jgi:SAM-dependent methyltransferase